LVSQQQLDLDQVSKVPMPRPRNCRQLDFHLGFHQEDVVLLQEHLSPENAPGTNCGALTSFQGGGALP